MIYLMGRSYLVCLLMKILVFNYLLKFMLCVFQQSRGILSSNAHISSAASSGYTPYTRSTLDHGSTSAHGAHGIHVPHASSVLTNGHVSSQGNLNLESFTSHFSLLSSLKGDTSPFSDKDLYRHNVGTLYLIVTTNNVFLTAGEPF